jgi:hypothetical protein
MLHPPNPEMRSPATRQSDRANSQTIKSTAKNIKIPPALQALGDEIRALKNYCARGLLTPEEAQQRIDDWQISYPPGWSDIAALVDSRGDQILLEARP